MNIPLDRCFKSGLIVSLADSQMLKSIRDITGQTINREQLEEWYSERDHLKKKKRATIEEKKRIRKLQDNIYNMMYIPQYITVAMESVSDYRKIYENGFVFNGRWFKRLSCSASQARVSVVVFCDCGSEWDFENKIEKEDSVRIQLKTRLDNGRDLGHKLAPSKYNAYFGLYSSASKKVTEPRFCIVPDYESTIPVTLDWSIETDWDRDDIMEERTLDTTFNRFDGSRLISPQMAEQWGRDLEEDYTPCQFVIRYAFTKGLVNEFDFVEWCRDELEGIKPEEEKYLIKDIYRNMVDLREIDVILTEGMAKLWDSWVSQEDFVNKAHENGIEWRITKYTPKQDKEMSTMNYQYLQTLDLKDENIEDICQETINYIKGVSYKDIYYTMLFLMGDKLNEDNIEAFLKSSDDYWLKSLVLNHNLLNDKYTKEKIRSYITKKIEMACLGRIMVNGNYQFLIPDSYGLMQWVTRQEVTGLLNDGEFYSKFWEDRNEEIISNQRSPLTWVAETYIVRNKYKSTNEEEQSVIDKIHKYYRYNYSGIQTNIWDDATMRFARSDFDGDIIFTTNNKNVIDCAYKNEKVTAYDVPKPKKKANLTEDDLFISDTFSFRQQIGPLTNLSTAMYALLPLFDKDSKEYKLLVERIKQTCVNQSKQIDSVESR